MHAALKEIVDTFPREVSIVLDDGSAAITWWECVGGNGGRVNGCLEVPGKLDPLRLELPKSPDDEAAIRLAMDTVMQTLVRDANIRLRAAKKE